jgi:hypothetical protein
MESLSVTLGGARRDRAIVIQSPRSFLFHDLMDSKSFTSMWKGTNKRAPEPCHRESRPTKFLQRRLTTLPTNLSSSIQHLSPPRLLCMAN